jgi:hypothetical protein
MEYSFQACVQLQEQMYRTIFHRFILNGKQRWTKCELESRSQTYSPNFPAYNNQTRINQLHPLRIAHPGHISASPQPPRNPVYPIDKQNSLQTHRKNRSVRKLERSAGSGSPPLSGWFLMAAFLRSRRDAPRATPGSRSTV